MTSADSTPTATQRSSAFEAIRALHVSPELAFGAGFLLIVVALSIAIVSIPA